MGDIRYGLRIGTRGGRLQQAGCEPDGATDKVCGMSEGTFLADRVRKARRDKRLSQQELANRAGVTLGVVGNLERGKTKPTPANQRAIMKVLDLDPDEPEGEVGETRHWPRDVSVFVDVMGLYLSSLPEDERYQVIHDLTRQAMRDLSRLGLAGDEA